MKQIGIWLLVGLLLIHTAGVYAALVTNDGRWFLAALGSCLFALYWLVAIKTSGYSKREWLHTISYIIWLGSAVAQFFAWDIKLFGFTPAGMEIQLLKLGTFLIAFILLAISLMPRNKLKLKNNELLTEDGSILLIVEDEKPKRPFGF